MANLQIYSAPRPHPVDEESYEKEHEPISEQTVSSIVDWDSPEDSRNPMNWSRSQKGLTIAIISTISFLMPLASSMFAPGIPQVMADFRSTNQLLGSFVVSIFVLGFAFGPLIIAPLSELYGRVYIYHCTNILFLVFTIACAASSSMGMLIAFRFFEGLAGSAPLTLGGGTISDMIVQEKRGGAMAIWAMGPLLGPVVGPIAGGFLTQAKSWRWVFWVIAMASGAVTIASFVLMRETYHPAILEAKAKKLRKETWNSRLTSKLASDEATTDLFRRAIIRPTKMLLFSPIVLLLSLYMAVVYGYLYLLFTTMTEVFEGRYHFSPGLVGLSYLGIGIGLLCGLAIFGGSSDFILKRQSAKGEMKPEYRLPPMIVGAWLLPIGLLWYGWSAEKHAHWIVPIIGMSFVGLGLIAAFMPIQTYLVDAFTLHAASALAGASVLRSIVGAFLPLAGPKLYRSLGLGWGNSLLAFIALAFSPLPWVFFKWGERIRKSPRFQTTF